MSSEQANNMKTEIKAYLSDADKLPAIPAIATRAISLAYNPDVDIKLLAEEISHDPGISADVIKLSNSAYFRPSREIRSVQEAIVTLGLKTVKDIIVISASRAVLNAPVEAYKISHLELWEHSILVAEIASRIAQMKKTKTSSDVAFTAGLFHDVGKVILAPFFKRVQMQVNMEMQKNPDASFTDTEKKFMGFSHTEAGAILLKQWKFPNELVEALVYNYHPEKAQINPELTAMVHVSNMIALASGVGVDVGGLNEKLSQEAIQKLGLKDEEIQELYSSLPEIIESLEDIRAMQ